jgi:hypothetical protein
VRPHDPLDDFRVPEGPPRHPVRKWFVVAGILFGAVIILLLLIRVNTPEPGGVLAP